MTTQSRRETILNVANNLIHKQGYNKTSIADIANEVGITKGNLQYHFRSKDDLLVAIIDLRMAKIDVVLKRFEQEFPDPMNRLRRIVSMVAGGEEGLSNYGCTFGTLNVELGKSQRPLQQIALRMLELLRGAIEKAFNQLNRETAYDRSVHMLAMIQGAALMSYVYQDGGLLQRECKLIMEWLETL